MLPDEADELAELKLMFSSPPAKGSAFNHRRPPWDATPLRKRPSALVDLKPVTLEPWAIDEDVYNRRFEMCDVGVPDRHLDQTARSRNAEEKKMAYLCRFDSRLNATARLIVPPLW